MQRLVHVRRQDDRQDAVGKLVRRIASQRFALFVKTQPSLETRCIDVHRSDIVRSDRFAIQSYPREVHSGVQSQRERLISRHIDGRQRVRRSVQSEVVRCDDDVERKRPRSVAKLIRSMQGDLDDVWQCKIIRRWSDAAEGEFVSIKLDPLGKLSPIGHSSGIVDIVWGQEGVVLEADAVGPFRWDTKRRSRVEQRRCVGNQENGG